MSRVSVSQPEYGVIGAGALSKSLIGNLPRKSRQIGPVAAVSYRVASRIANSLRAGYAIRDAAELDICPAILFHAPSDQVAPTAKLLEAANLSWKGKAIVFCDCEIPGALLDRFRSLGASTALARRFGVADSIMVEGMSAALACAHRLAAELDLRALEIKPDSGDLFAAAITLATGALTPLIHRAAGFLRATGLRDKEAVRVATALFEQTSREYGHSGRQSWTWHVREPAAGQLDAELGAVPEPFRESFRQLIVAGFHDFEKHPEAAAALEAGSPRPGELR